MDAHKKILLVEDEPKVAKVYETALRYKSYDVTTCDSGDQAVDLLKKDSTYDLILLDLMLPGKNGIEVLKEVNLDAKIKAIPVVLLTNLGQGSLVQEASKLGAVKYMIKAETSPNILIEEIQKILDTSTT